MCNLKVQTKAALKGWSALTGDKTGSTPQSAGPKKVSTIFCWKLHSRFNKTLCPISFNVQVSTSETFAEFRKAAKEKADRERGLKEQQVVVFHSPSWSYGPGLRVIVK